MGFFSDLFGGGESDAAKDAARLQKRAYADLAPWRELGTQAVGDLSSIYLTGEKPFTASPGYDFRRSEAERGLSNFLAARGLSGSGRAVRGAARLQDQLAVFRRYLAGRLVEREAVRQALTDQRLLGNLVRVNLPSR